MTVLIFVIDKTFSFQMTLPVGVFRGIVLRSSVDLDRFMAPDSAKVSFGLSIALLLAADF